VLFLLLFSAIFITSTITLINKKDKLQKLNEQKFKALLTAAPDGILVVNQEGTIEVVNNKVLELFGYTKTELLGKTVEELVPVEFKSRHVSFRNSYFQDETKSRAMGMGLELYGLRKDRTKFAVEISLSPVNLEGNTMVFSSIRDVTLRNLERAKSRQKDLIFQTLVDRIEDYAIIHLDGEGRVTSWNNGAKNILGYDQKDILGRNFSILFNESNGDSRQLTEFIQQARTNKRVEEERNIIKKDGNTFWSHFVITPINSVEDTPAGFVMVLRDETKNKLTEQLLTSFNEELKLEVELKTQELAGLTNQLRSFSSHLQEAREQERKYIARELHDELGQMLTGLRMDMVWLKTHISPEHTDLKKRIEQALQLLNETKESMRRISKQLHPSQLEDLGLNAAISSLCKDFQSRTNFNLSLKNELVEDLRLPIPANLSLAVYRIIQESLTNILKHSNADKIDLSLEEIGGVINVTISDNGTGFDIKNVSGNTSLGIIGMRERALSVSGTFDISSGNEGTRVKLSVPLAKKYQN
jgi:PAS domain S-box-containing protein